VSGCTIRSRIAEFWNVCTRPARVNGLGYTVERTQEALATIDAVFHRLECRPESGREWNRIVAHPAVVGRAVHDAQLVAAMAAYRLSHILTLNITDFRRYRNEITPVHPVDVPGGR
jgi:hypothetical protein